MPERIVIALGGNALQSGNSAPTAEAQLEVVKKTSERIAEISRRGYEMAVVHGNGPRWDGSCWPGKRPGTWCRPCPLMCAVP